MCDKEILAALASERERKGLEGVESNDRRVEKIDCVKWRVLTLFADRNVVCPAPPQPQSSSTTLDRRVELETDWELCIALLAGGGSSAAAALAGEVDANTLHLVERRSSFFRES